MWGNGSYETLECMYQTKLHYIPEDRSLNTDLNLSGYDPLFNIVTEPVESVEAKEFLG
jgi:hypothetical protein